MNTSRAFFIMGGIWILIGIPIGMYMGPKQDFTLTPLHAHINLVGFVLSTLFGLVYSAKPAMDNGLARAHFWLHLAGGVILLPFLFMVLTARMAEETGGLIMAVGEVMILVGMVLYLVNMIRNG